LKISLPLLICVLLISSIPSAAAQTLDVTLDRESYLPASTGVITATLRESGTSPVTSANITAEVIYYLSDGRITVDLYSLTNASASRGEPLTVDVRFNISTSAAPGYGNVALQIRYRLGLQSKIISSPPVQFFIQSPFKIVADQLSEELTITKANLTQLSATLAGLTSNVTKLLEQNKQLATLNEEMADKSSELITINSNLQSEIRDLSEKVRSEQQKSSSLEEHLSALQQQNYLIGREIITYTAVILTVGVVIVIFYWLIRTKRLIIEIRRSKEGDDTRNVGAVGPDNGDIF
jgi:hypothetical protein